MDNHPLIEAILADIRRRSSKKKAVCIAIDGVGGSGKTTLAEFLRDRLEDCRVVQLDDFYSPALGAADLVRFKEQVLLPIHHLREARFQIFDWKTNRLSDWHTLPPKGIFVFEGVYALDETLRDYYDVKVWIDCPAELGFRRGVARDLSRDAVDLSEKWKNIWMPLEAKYRNVQQPDKSADYILHAGGD
jgi:uridine kinase